MHAWGWRTWLPSHVRGASCMRAHAPRGEIWGAHPLQQCPCGCSPGIRSAAMEPPRACSAGIRPPIRPPSLRPLPPPGSVVLCQVPLAHRVQDHGLQELRAVPRLRMRVTAGGAAAGRTHAHSPRTHAHGARSAAGERACPVTFFSNTSDRPHAPSPAGWYNCPLCLGVCLLPGCCQAVYLRNMEKMTGQTCESQCLTCCVLTMCCYSEWAGPGNGVGEGCVRFSGQQCWPASGASRCS